MNVTIRGKYYLFLCFSFCLSIFAQDTSYVRSPVYKDNIRITSGAVMQHIDLISTAHGKDVANSVLVPNVSDNLRIGFTWHFLSLGYTTHIPNIYFSKEKFGTTKYNDFTLNFYGKWFGCEMIYRQYDGLFSPNNNYTSSVIRPDVSFLHAGMTLVFIGNSKHFSYKAAFSRSRIQKKSAGGFVMMLECSYRKLKGDTSIIAPNLNSVYYFDDYRSLNGVGFTSLLARPGYAYNFVFKGGKFYVCPLLTLSGGVSIYNISTDFTSKYIVGLHTDLAFRLSGGYESGKRFFASLAYNSDVNTNYFTKTILLNHTTFSVLLTVGLRFGKR
ncbi:MAG: DUF4421 family protein [Bacteroidia bacterium]